MSEEKMEVVEFNADKSVVPVVDLDQMGALIENRKKLLLKILEPDDVQKIQNKEFKKKRYWRKLAGIFGVDLEKREERCETSDKGIVTYHFTFRAITSTGHFVDGSGSCTQNEKGLSKSIHDTRATAETRAKNRAIADMLAFGEVTAEEVDYDREAEAASQREVSKPAAPSKKDKIKSEIDGAVKEKHITIMDVKAAIWDTFDKRSYAELSEDEAIALKALLLQISHVDLSEPPDVLTVKEQVISNITNLGAFKPVLNEAYTNGQPDVKLGIVQYLVKKHYIKGE